MARPSGSDDVLVRAFFADRPLAQGLWESLVDKVSRWGPVTVAATRSRVALVARTRFLWVHQASRDGITLGFLHPDPLGSPRLRSARVGRRWSHHLKMGGAPDPELLGWLKVAFATDTAPAAAGPSRGRAPRRTARTRD